MIHIIADGKPIPTELRREEQALRKRIELEDDNTVISLCLFRYLTTLCWYSSKICVQILVLTEPEFFAILRMTACFFVFDKKPQ